ncbi:glutathione S-transferase family protein [Labrenzia sp. R4_2]|uniref:glutathione S-transferase family protein n=1 Tax=Labrenzia sp. R4_2 TaxID=2821107 RepID=UPI001AD9D1BB|nr:glutathione S-transferase family protein [Labrenzia sp. R4_2]
MQDELCCNSNFEAIGSTRMTGHYPAATKSDIQFGRQLKMIKIHGRKTSANVQPVIWCLDELGVEYERLDVGGPFGGTDTQEFLGMNPLGLVPVLEEDGQAISEAVTILRYLMRRFGGHPSDPMAAAQIEKWADMSRQHIYVPLIPTIFIQMVRVTAEERNGAAVAQAEAALKQAMGIFEANIKGPFFGGDALNLVDYQVGGLLYRYYELDFDRADLPQLKAYYDRLCERKAYQENIMIDFSAMKVPGA